jgi:hypothetical protein
MAAYRRSMYTDSPLPVTDTSFTAFESDSDSGSGPSSDDDNPATSENFLDTSGINNGPAPGLTQFPPPNSVNNTNQRNPPLAPIHGTRTRYSPTLPQYIDARPTIKTYFKIYSPSKGGRLLSVYESAPDKFDFSQSWGWKSSTLMLDEGFSSPTSGSAMDVPNVPVTEQDDAGAEQIVDGSLAAEVQRTHGVEKERRKRREGALRFMVVIGNL